MWFDSGGCAAAADGAASVLCAARRFLAFLSILPSIVERLSGHCDFVKLLRLCEALLNEFVIMLIQNVSF